MKRVTFSLLFHLISRHMWDGDGLVDCCWATIWIHYRCYYYYYNFVLSPLRSTTYPPTSRTLGGTQVEKETPETWKQQDKVASSSFHLIFPLLTHFTWSTTTNKTTAQSPVTTTTTTTIMFIPARCFVPNDWILFLFLSSSPFSPTPNHSPFLSIPCLSFLFCFT